MRHRTDYLMLKKIFVLAFFFVFLQSTALMAQEIKKVIVFPFEMNVPYEGTRLQEEIFLNIVSELKKSRYIQVIERDRLASIIKKRRISESLAVMAARQLGADMAIMGSFTEIGENINIDITIIEAKEPQPPDRAFFSGRVSEGVSPLLKQVQETILARIEVGHRIASLEIRGNRTIDSQAIIQVIKSTPGSILSETRISDDVRAIYRTGYFANVSVKMADAPGGGRVIIFEVEERPMITNIVITGNRAVKRGEIEEIMSVKVRQRLNREKIKQDVEKIRELYNKKGYLNAEVSDIVEQDGERDSRVIINIREGNKLYVKKISFQGNMVYSDRTLKQLMTTKEKGFFHFLDGSGILNRDHLNQDIQKINAFYLNNGFIHAQIGEPEITHDEKSIYIIIPIIEGRRFRVGKVDISGDTLNLPKESLLARLSLTRKIYYDRGAVIKDIDTIMQACSDEGYAYANVSPRVFVAEKELKVDVTFHIEKGQQVFLNRINIIGNTKTRDKVIRRQLALAEGDLFRSSKLRTSFMALNRLRYFEEIDFQIEPGPADNLSDLNVHVKEKPTGMFSVGAGYSAVDQAIFTAQVSQHNLFGRGQILSLKANISARATMYDISFIEPWLFDVPLWSKFDVWNLSRAYDSYHLETTGFGLAFSYPIWHKVSASVGYRFASNEISDISPLAASYIKEQAGTTISNTVSMALARDTTDDFIFPSQGSRNVLSADYTGGVLGGDTSFNRYMLTSAWFYPLPFNTTAGLRGRVGYIEGTRGKAVPIYERFFLGGMHSLRGLRSVGPVDPATGDIIGGLTMLNLNFEYIFPLMKEAGMKGLIFYDTGNTWLSGYHLNDLRHTAGVGVRWYSPIGPLRLEWGYVLDRRIGETPSRWEFTIGMFM